MLRIKQFSILTLAALLVALLATACAPSKAEKLNNEGNDDFAKQAFQDALVAYQTAQIEDPELAEPYYNAANALYRQGAYADALKQMEMALNYTDKEALAQAGYYNQGNSFYNQQDLQSAVDFYTQALLINPDDQDAKYNLELALEQLQQQQQNEEQQNEDQQQEDQQDQENQDESQEGESQEDQQDQGDQQQEDQQDQGDQSQEDQQQEGDQGQQEEEQQADSQEGEESDEGQEGQEESQDEAQQQDGQQGEQQEDQQQQGQGQPQDGEPQEDQPGQLNQMPQPGQRMTAEQAEQLLAAIARDGQTLQQKLGQIFSVPWTPPVQDW
jgi:tetratricopeptide (TPR) repeat protein